MNKVISIILLVMTTFWSSCTFLSKKVIYYDNGKTAECRNCSAIKKIPKNIKVLQIDTRKCQNIPRDWDFPELEELIIISGEINFPNETPSTKISSISILDPILDSVPNFIYGNSNLENLVIFLNDDLNLNDDLFEGLKKIKKLKLGIRTMSRVPKFIYSLENLEELVILSDNVEKNLVLKKNLLKLTKLKRIEIPIDFSQNSEILANLPNLKYLRLQTFSNLDLGKEHLKRMIHLKEICIDEISASNQVLVAELLPEVQFICRNNHLKPFDW